MWLCCAVLIKNVRPSVLVSEKLGEAGEIENSWGVRWLAVGSDAICC